MVWGIIYFFEQFEMEGGKDRHGSWHFEQADDSSERVMAEIGIVEIVQEAVDSGHFLDMKNINTTTQMFWMKPMF